LLQDPLEPDLVRVEEPDHRVADRLRQRPILGCDHAAEAHPAAPQHIGVEAGVGLELCRRGGLLDVDRRQRVGEALVVPPDERLAELQLPSGHDAWVVGDEPVVVVDWYGASNYAKGGSA
jgi:hypothetical protein